MSTIPLTLLFNQLKKEEFDLLRQFRDFYDQEVRKVQVQFFPRYGASGAKVILARFAEHGGVPYIIKMANKNDINREWNACSDVKSYFNDAQVAPPKYSGDIGAISYTFHGSTDTTEFNSTELNDLLFKDKNNIEANLKILKNLYETNFDTAYQSANRSKFSWCSEYEWYLRERGADEMIEIAIGSQKDKEKVSLLGFEILNPLFYIDQLDAVDEGLLGPIHGDLYASNIVLDRNKYPRLIDFCWSKKRGHLLKDFVLMECSLRFMLLPKYLCLDSIIEIDKRLNQCITFDKPELIDNIIKNSKSISFFEYELLQYVKYLRTIAKKTYKDLNFPIHYMKAMYIILYGLLKFHTYSIHRGILTLGLLSDEIYRNTK